MSEQIKYDLPDACLLRALDEAHEKGFRDFLRDNGHDERCQAHRKRAADALSNLIDGLNKGPVPNYNDPYVAAAYIVKYHLSHCMMAFWAFKSFFDQFDVLNPLYVYDVGAGTGAGRVGLALALSKYDKQPDIYFDAHEPAKAMQSAGTFFWQAFQNSVPDFKLKHYRQYSTLKNLPKLPANAERMVTAFHLSLPWNNQQHLYREEHAKSAENTLKETFRIVSPDFGIFTINDKKKEALHRVNDSYDWDKEFGMPLIEIPNVEIPNDDCGVKRKSSLYTDCAVNFGFEVPKAEDDQKNSVRHWSRHRFGSPKNSILFLRRRKSEKRRKPSLEVTHFAQIDEQEKLKREQSERHSRSFPASNQREEKERLEWEKIKRRWSEEQKERKRAALRLLAHKPS